jgi:hypothetical protein
MTVLPARVSRCAAGAALLLAALPGAARAQYPTAKFKGRLQAEFRTSDIHSANADGTPATINTVVGNEFFLRRFYLEADAQIAESIHAKMELNATRRAVNLEDAWVDVGLGRFVTWRFGQEKKPVERLEVMSSSLYPTVERGAQMAGLRNPNLVSQNNFLTAVGFTGHDVGTSLELHTADSAAVPVSLRLGVWTGQGKDNPEVNNAKTFGARLTVAPLPMLSLGASFVSHDDPVSVTVGSGPTATKVIATDSAGRSTAFGLDAEWGNGERGAHVVADAAIGKEGRVGAFSSTLAGLRATAPAAGFSPRFRSFHVVGEYKLLFENSPVFTGIGPLLRFDRTEPDTGSEVSSTMLTPGVNLYFSPRAWLMVNYDVITPGARLDLGRGAGATVHSFKSMMRIFF